SWLARRELLVWIAVPFVLVHAVVARKDPRFLIPLIYLLGPWFGVCLDRLLLKAPSLSARQRTAVAAAATTFCIVDLAVMGVAITRPANGQIAFDRWAWQQSRRGVQTIYAYDSPESGLPENVTDSFYSTGVMTVPFSHAAQDEGGASRFVYYTGTTLPA